MLLVFLSYGLAGGEIGSVDFGHTAAQAQGAHHVADVDALVADLFVVKGREADHIDARRGEIHPGHLPFADVVFFLEARDGRTREQGGVLLQHRQRSVAQMGQEHHVVVHPVDPHLDLVDIAGVDGIFHSERRGHRPVRRSAQRTGIHRSDQRFDGFLVIAHTLVLEQVHGFAADGQVVFAGHHAARTAVHRLLVVLQLPEEQLHDAGMVLELLDIDRQAVGEHPAAEHRISRIVGIGLFPVVFGEVVVEPFGNDQLLQLVTGGDGLLFQFFQVTGSRLGLAFLLRLLDFRPKA